MLSSIILGIIQGAIIGLIALGIVLVYKGSRVFNFAQAEYGTLAAFFLYFFIDVVNVPYPAGVIFALIGIAAVGWVVERLVVRPLFDAPKVTLLVATAGVALLFISLEFLIGGTQVRSLSKAFQGSAFDLTTVTISYQVILTLAVVTALAFGSAWFFNKTDLGLAVLATSQEPVATELVGIGTKRISSFVWVSAAILGGIAGILQVSASGLFPGVMTRDYLLLGLTAAVLGGITSIAGAFLGGALVGVIQGFGLWLESQYGHTVNIPALPSVLVFIVLLVVLSVRPQGLLGSEA
jgi:branched-chain amino acid transport system permease protein